MKDKPIMTYELLAFATSNPRNDIRYRRYTRSKLTAERFSKLPRIQFTDSGHGIVFTVREMGKGEKRNTTITYLQDYVNGCFLRPIGLVKELREAAQ